MSVKIRIKPEGPPQEGPPPSKGVIVHDFAPHCPVFRKTAEQLACEFLPRLNELMIITSFEEVVDAIRGRLEPNILTTIVEGWVRDEEKRGIKII